MTPDFLQFVFYAIIYGAMMKTLQAWLAQRNPDSQWLKALAFVH